jgi:hypothetical protein
MSRPIRILSIDGGGIRGVMAASFLVSLERALRDATGNHDARLADYFDFFAGTSTGGVLTTLLLTPDPDRPGRPRFSAEQVLAIYEETGDLVFSSSLWRRLRSGSGFLYQKFDAHGLEDAFHRYYGETRLRELLRPCLITSYDILRSRPHFFTQHDAATRPGFDFAVRDVARATAAAPSFFEVALCKNELGEEFPLIDGGVFANNPSLCAYAEVRNLHESSSAADMRMLSLGTGEVPMSLQYETARAYGVMRWMGPLADIMIRGVSTTVDYQLQKIFGTVENPRGHYLRVNTQLAAGALPSPEIDDARPENIVALRERGEQLFQEHEDSLQEFIQKLLPREESRFHLWRAAMPALLSGWLPGRDRLN